MTIEIRPYTAADKEVLVALSLRAWQPVFDKLEPAVPGCVYGAFYPDGWQARQAADIAALLDSDGDDVRVAVHEDRRSVGSAFGCTRKIRWARATFWPSTRPRSGAALPPR